MNPLLPSPGSPFFSEAENACLGQTLRTAKGAVLDVSHLLSCPSSVTNQSCDLG